jgi:hypothetical protein
MADKQSLVTDRFRKAKPLPPFDQLDPMSTGLRGAAQRVGTDPRLSDEMLQALQLLAGRTFPGATPTGAPLGAYQGMVKTLKNRTNEQGARRPFTQQDLCHAFGRLQHKSNPEWTQPELQQLHKILDYHYQLFKDYKTWQIANAVICSTTLPNDQLDPQDPAIMTFVYELRKATKPQAKRRTGRSGNQARTARTPRNPPASSSGSGVARPAPPTVPAATQARR